MRASLTVFTIVLISAVFTFGTASAEVRSPDGQKVSQTSLKKKKGKKKPKKGKAKAKDPVNKKVATAGIDHGIVFSSNSVKKDGSGMKVDLIVYKQGKGFKVNAGRKGTSYNPLHDFGAKKYASLGDVPCFKPGKALKNKFKKKLEPGQAFTVQGNKSSGTYRVRIKKIAKGKITFEHDKCK